MTNIKEKIKSVRENAKDINELGNCTNVVQRVVYKKIDVDYDVTLCTKCTEKHSICHRKCTCIIENVSHPDVQPENIRKGCSCFDDLGYCMSCPGKHHWS